MSAQRDERTRPPIVPDYRWARRLFLIGVLVAVVSLLVLVVARGSAHDSGSSARTPGDGTGAPGGPTMGLPPETLPGETAEEYRWRAEADNLRQQARTVLQALLDSGDPAAVPGLQAQLERAADLLDHEAQADALRQKARASDLGGSEPTGPLGSTGTASASSVTSAVALVGALGGMLTAAAGLLTAWVAWHKAARGG